MNPIVQKKDLTKETIVNPHQYKWEYSKLFLLPMFVWAENDRNTTTPGIRKYYSQNQFEKLYQKWLIDESSFTSKFMDSYNNRIVVEGGGQRIKKFLKSTSSLSSYPNEFWKYPVVIYYLRYKNSENFESDFWTFKNMQFCQQDT